MKAWFMILIWVVALITHLGRDRRKARSAKGRAHVQVIHQKNHGNRYGIRRGRRVLTKVGGEGKARRGRGADKGKKIAGTRKPPEPEAVKKLKAAVAKKAEPFAEAPTHDGKGKTPIYKDHPGPLIDKPHDVKFMPQPGQETPDLIFTPITDNPEDDMLVDQTLGGPARVKDLGTYEPGDRLQISAALPDLPEGLRKKLQDAYGDKVDGYYKGATFYPWNPEAVKDRPVSEGVRVPEGGGKKLDGIRGALDAIDGVHTDGVLTTIPIETKRKSPTGPLGQFRSRYDGKPADIRIMTSDQPRATTAHEMGHFLDLDGLGKKGEFTTDDPNGELAPLLEHLGATPTVRKLTDMRNNPDEYAKSYTYTMPRSGERHTERVKPDDRHLRYLLSPAEIFARAYAQYIAEKGDNPKLKQEMDKIVDAAHKDKYSYPRQWTPEEMKGIIREFDKLFKGRGWLKA